MRKVYICYILICFSVANLNSLGQISQTEFDRKVDSINFLLVTLSVKDFGDSVIIHDLNKLFQNSLKDTPIDSLTSFLEKQNLPVTKKLSDLIDSIKQSYVENLSPSDATEKIIGELYKDPTIQKFINSPSHPYVKQIMASLKRELALIKEIEVLQSNISENQEIGLKNKNQRILVIILSVYSFIVTMAAAYFIYAYNKEKKLEKKSNHSNKTRKAKEKIASNKPEPITTPDSKSNNLNEPDNRLASDDTNLEKSKDKTSTLEEKHQIFYLPAPSSKEGSFLNDLKTESINKDESFYKFTLEDIKEASFQLINDPKIIKKAVSASAYVIEPVCESENEYFSGATSLIIGEPGRCILEGDEWVLQKKAKIKYT